MSGAARRHFRGRATHRIREVGDHRAAAALRPFRHECRGIARRVPAGDGKAFGFQFADVDGRRLLFDPRQFGVLPDLARDAEDRGFDLGHRLGGQGRGGRRRGWRTASCAAAGLAWASITPPVASAAPTPLVTKSARRVMPSSVGS